MKKKVFILHGTGGHPLQNWFSWLKEELEKKYFSVFVPQFPNANKPQFEHWWQELEKYKEKIGGYPLIASKLIAKHSFL